MSTDLTPRRRDLPDTVPPRGLGHRRRRRDRELREWTPPPRRSSRARRVVLVVAALGALALSVPVVLWARYRMEYVVSHNAQIKGPITHVGPQIPGVVTSVEVEVGQRARAGQVLARLEDRQLRANVMRAESHLNEARARANSADARISAAQSQYNEASARHQQQSALATSGAISQNDLLAAQTRLSTARAHESSAVADRQASGAELAAAEGELRLARAELDAAVVRAPADGWVVRRVAEPGTTVMLGQPIVDLWIGDQVWVEAWLEEDQLANVTVGSPARVTVRRFGDRVLSGVVESIAVSTDAELPAATVPQPRSTRMRATPVVCARIRLERAEGLFPGLSAVVGIKRAGSQ
jgi:membrane fusion protein (multidrug efflux system)